PLTSCPTNGTRKIDKIIEQQLCQYRLRSQALARRRQAAFKHGRSRVQTCCSWPNLPKVHFRQLRRTLREARRRRWRLRGIESGRSGRIPRRKYLLGSTHSALGLSSEQRQTTNHRQDRR